MYIIYNNNIQIDRYRQRYIDINTYICINIYNIYIYIYSIYNIYIYKYIFKILPNKNNDL